MNKKDKNNLTNEIARVRQKLKIFDMPGASQVMFDLIDDVTKDAGRSFYTTDDRIMFVRNLKAKLENELENLLAQQEKYQQGKLNL